jgi:hypothetical protein
MLGSLYAMLNRKYSVLLFLASTSFASTPAKNENEASSTIPFLSLGI